MKRISYLTVFVVLVFLVHIPCFGAALQTDQVVKLQKESYTLENIFKTLESVPNLKISYNASTLPMDMKVVVEKTNPTLKEVIAFVEKTGRVEGVINDNYLVFRLKKLDKEYRIRGEVNDSENGEPIVGVNVYIKGTGQGVVSDLNGEYSLATGPGNFTLVFSFVGYETREINLELFSDQTVNVQLVLQKTELREIEVIAQRKFFGNMEYGREISSVKSKEIEKINSSNASDILHARLAGVWATKTSGAPGDQQKIRVRGQTSFFSSAEPLYVIDGVPVPIVNLASLGIADLNMNDIDNVTVLRDASTTALYGYQGGNGVILIDTKQSSDSKISFSYKTGLQWFNNYYDLMNTKDFLESLQLAKDKVISPLYNFYPEYTNTLCDHNRQDEIFRNGIVNEYQLSGGGNTKGLKYYWSGNYSGQAGILPGSAYKRGTFTTRLSKTFGNKLALSASYRGSFQDNENNQNTYGGNRIIFEGINKSPCLECTPDSLIYKIVNQGISYFKRIHYGNVPLNSSELLQSIIDNNNESLIINNHAISFLARYSIAKELSVNVMESAMMRSSRYSSNMQYFPDQSFTTSILFPILFESNEDVRLLNHQINVSYNKAFGLNEISVVLANRYYTDNLWWQVDTMENKLPEHYSIRNSMAGYGMQGSVIRKMNTGLAHISYNYRNTYFASVIANASWLREGVFTHNFDLFPSASVSWNMTGEPFMSSNKWINELNLYSNFGISGNYPLSGLANDIYTSGDYSEGGTVTESYPYIEQFANHRLKHESTKELDFGFKFSALNNRIRLNGALYNKQVGNQIIQRDIPHYYGGGKIFINLGEIAVKGYELELEAVPVSSANFTWHLIGNFSSSQQKVTKLADDEDITFYTSDILFPEFIVKENEPLGNIYGYKSLGKWKGEYKNNRSYAKVYDMAFYNSDTTDTKITEKDKVVIGNSIPDFTWNLNSSFRYKNFTLDVSLYSVWGVEKYNATRAATIMTGLNRDVLGFYNDSLTVLGKAEFYESNLFIDDASFIRLKSLTIGYTSPKKIMGIKWALSLSFENLITITNYRGYDPEATIYTDNNFSDNAIDKGAYPSPKSFYAKISLQF